MATHRLRRRCHQHVGEMMEAPGYKAFLMQMEQRLEAHDWLGDRRNAESTAFAAAIPALLDRQARKVSKAGRSIPRLSGRRLHDLRKKLKKLGDGVEFAADVQGKPGGGYAKCLKNVLGVLGELNDLAVADRCLSKATGSSSRARRVVRPLRKRLRRKAVRRLGQLHLVWRRFKNVEPSWKRESAAEAPSAD